MNDPALLSMHSRHQLLPSAFLLPFLLCPSPPFFLLYMTIPVSVLRFFVLEPLPKRFKAGA